MKKSRYAICFFCMCLVIGVIFQISYRNSLERMLSETTEYTEESPAYVEAEMSKELIYPLETGRESGVTDETMPEQTGYFLTAEDGYVVVYREDRTSLFMRTNIALSEFPEEVQEVFSVGILLKSEDMVYEYLENCTS